MNFSSDVFGKLTGLDRVTLEGNEVVERHLIKGKASPAQNANQDSLGEINLYRLSVKRPDGGVDLRDLRINEISHLIETEHLVIDRGFYSPSRQQDREIYGGHDLYGATKAQRDTADRKWFCAKMIHRFWEKGMKLTRAAVDALRPQMLDEFERYQALQHYGTDRANSTQKFHKLPSADSLLKYYRKIKKFGSKPNVFLRAKSFAEHEESEIQRLENFALVMAQLGKYASSTCPSKKKVIGHLFDVLKAENKARKSQGRKDKIRILSQRTYERWIDRYLDPFEVCIQRNGLAAAQKKFGSVESGLTARFPGEMVQIDAWMFHLVTLDITREQWNRMTPKQRSKVKKVRRWITVMIDVATRCILGFSISKHPTVDASLEALRMSASDKTYLLRDIGIKEGHYNYCCPIQQVANDNGSEFGKLPFGGAMFAQGVRTLGASLMNTAAGVSWLRGHIERFFRTCDLQFARYLPGYTSNNPQTRNDRKPGEEACITDDELHKLFTAFIARYHNSPHRGLNGRTPAAVWDELIQHEDYDPLMMPRPGQLREACGFEAEANITENGISYAGLTYANAFTRDQRLARLDDRVAKPGEKVRIKVDPFDLGGISVVANEELIAVPCLNPDMRGKTLRQWQEAKAAARQRIKAENLSREGAQTEAIENAEKLVNDILRTSDIGIMGYTSDEIDRAKRELSFGKGQHERPFIGQDEYVDPPYAGTEIQDNEFTDEHHDQEEYREDIPTPMDRFRSDAIRRRRHTGGAR
ncbi:hypothetical protein [uncultured Martelella sp.]|uniref:hypothetical protein n=1 Tax=uncultured Martelella sp. TaxID=392331 RepID=UPI0029C8FC36|nr:hypothetical protein [uncultured Martelella sp.]